MAKYTTEVRTICEVYADLEERGGYDDIETIINKSRENIFDFKYPIFDESYRSVLETKIIKRYYTREICEETVGLWKLRLNTKMNEIMPFYNQFYKSELIEFNPMYDTEILKEHKGNNDSTKDDNEITLTTTTKNDTTDVTQKDTSSNKENDSNNRTENNKNNVRGSNNSTSYELYSDTPQGGLINVENETYLTDARKIKNNNAGSSDEVGENTSNTLAEKTSEGSIERTGKTVGIGNTNLDGTKTNKTTLKNTDEYLDIVKGKQGTESYSSLLLKYRETFLNIDLQIINELETLFFGLW